MINNQKADSLETLLHRMVNRIRQSLELSVILSSTVAEVRAFLHTDRVKIYQFDTDGSGEVVAESVNLDKLPSLLGQRFPAEDNPKPDEGAIFARTSAHHRKYCFSSNRHELVSNKRGQD